jgi:hypothetical protein
MGIINWVKRSIVRMARVLYDNNDQGHKTFYVLLKTPPMSQPVGCFADHNSFSVRI